jgi:hypothetical protein
MELSKPKHIIRVYKEDADIKKSGWKDIYQGNNFMLALYYFMSEKKASGIDDMVSWTWSGNYED